MNKDVTFCWTRLCCSTWTVAVCYVADFHLWKEKMKKRSCAGFLSIQSKVLVLFKTCNCEATLFGVTSGSKSIFKILSETLLEIKTPINSHCKSENWLIGVCWGCLEQTKRCSFIYYAPRFGWGFQGMFSMFTAKGFWGGKIPPTGYVH